ncbi:MAG: redoxin domain-containing protein [Gammaproteobacteria bacterium]|nr:redoxin domain-containing protein [Gammaproteobacteria bacterium]
MQLEAAVDDYTEAGLGVMAISYDSVEILESFSERNGGFRYTMLSDPESEIIESFGLRNPNPEPGSRGDGMAFPGSYIVDVDGVVQEKFFEQDHRIRTTHETVLLKTVGVGGGRRTEVQLPQFDFVAYASQDEISRGNEISLIVDVALPDRMHLYAPGSDYTAVDLQVADHPMLRVGPLELPEAEMLYLEPIDETVPVYHDSARIQRTFTLAPGYEDSTLELDATLVFQTCDDEICFPPGEFDFTFDFDVRALDRQRAPEAIQH